MNWSLRHDTESTALLLRSVDTFNGQHSITEWKVGRGRPELDGRTVRAEHTPSGMRFYFETPAGRTYIQDDGGRAISTVVKCTKRCGVCV